MSYTPRLGISDQNCPLFAVLKKTSYGFIIITLFISNQEYFKIKIVLIKIKVLATTIGTCKPFYRCLCSVEQYNLSIKLDQQIQF